MAISPVDPIVMMLEGKRQRYMGDLLTLGRQQIIATHAQIARQAALLGYDLDQSYLRDQGGQIADVSFFRALGFASVSSLDANDYEGATFIHDLNRPTVPPMLEDRFDVVFDRGTSEHVFHLPNLLSAVSRMVKPGGRVIHYAPSSNHIDHGFYMFSPSLFADYYLANGFEIPTLYLVTQPWLRARPRVQVFDYYPGCLEMLSHGGLDSRQVQIFCVAVRCTDNPVTVVPQQGRYETTWGRRAQPSTKGKPRQILSRLASPIVAPIRQTRIGDAFWGAVVNPLKRERYWRKNLKLVLSHQV